MPRKLTEKSIWPIFSKYIREKESRNGICTCFTCGKKVPFKRAHAGHFISRRYKNTKFDQLNVHAQCAYCNLYLAGNQYVYSLKLDEKYGKGTAYCLYLKSLIPKKFTQEDLALLKKHYTMQKIYCY